MVLKAIAEIKNFTKKRAIDYVLVTIKEVDLRKV